VSSTFSVLACLLILGALFSGNVWLLWSGLFLGCSALLVEAA
jgi:hypothetical protein